MHARAVRRQKNSAWAFQGGSCVRLDDVAARFALSVAHGGVAAQQRALN